MTTIAELQKKNAELQKKIFEQNRIINSMYEACEEQIDNDDKIKQCSKCSLFVCGIYDDGNWGQGERDVCGECLRMEWMKRGW